MAKAHAEGAELRYEKGKVMKDKEGNIRYESGPFSIKDAKFKSRAFNDDIKKELKDVLNKHGFKYRLFNPKKEVPQIHVGHERSRQPETIETGAANDEKNLSRRRLEVKAAVDKKVRKLHFMKPLTF